MVGPGGVPVREGRHGTRPRLLTSFSVRSNVAQVVRRTGQPVSGNFGLLRADLDHPTSGGALPADHGPPPAVHEPPPPTGLRRRLCDDQWIALIFQPSAARVSTISSAPAELTIRPWN